MPPAAAPMFSINVVERICAPVRVLIGSGARVHFMIAAIIQPDSDALTTATPVPVTDGAVPILCSGMLKQMGLSSARALGRRKIRLNSHSIVLIPPDEIMQWVLSEASG